MNDLEFRGIDTDAERVFDTKSFCPLAHIGVGMIEIMRQGYADDVQRPEFLDVLQGREFVQNAGVLR